MLDMMCSLGNGIVSNLLSDTLNKKLNIFKDKKVISNFIQNLNDWEIEFEKQNDSTIIMSDAFFSCIKYYNVIEKIVVFVLEPSIPSETENAFLNNLNEKTVKRIEESIEKKLSQSELNIIKEFLRKILTTIKNFLMDKASLEERGYLYIICQTYAENEHTQKILLEQFRMQEQSIQQIVERLDKLTQIAEVEAQIKENLHLWNSRQIKNMGDRYTPDLNIPIKIMEYLHGASLDQQFRDIFYNKSDKFLIAMRQAQISEIDSLCDNIERHVTNLNFLNISINDIDVILKEAASIKYILKCEIKKCCKNCDNKKTINSKIYQLYDSLSAVNDFYDYLTDTTVKAAVSPYIVLSGDGGSGKSHLIADYVDSRNSLGYSSLLLLGQQFSTGVNILSVLPTWLGCSITYHELFKTIEAIACTQKSRVIICIDALNEGAGVSFWNSALGGLIDFLKEFPHIGLLISVRSQYMDFLFDNQDSLKKKMIHITHSGFGEAEYDAIYKYFTFYGVTVDSVIFPIKEFGNPLFLRLFCIAYRNTHVGLDDISLPHVYSKYIDVMEQKVSERCNYNKSIKLIPKIIDEMISKRFAKHSGSMPLSANDAALLIAGICKKWNISADVYSALITEGVLTQGVSYDNDDYVYVTYERLEDYFLAQRIVSEYSQLSREQFNEQYSWILYKNDILQIFGIILAEEKGCELSDVFSTNEERNLHEIRDAIFYGLPWRKASSVMNNTVDYINTEIIKCEYSFIHFIDILFVLSARPDHLLNAKKSFNFFKKYRMPDRDAKFIAIFDELYYDQDSALYRLVEWGLIYAAKQTITDDIAGGYATILSWLLISSNNELRDKATKAIICILISHTDALLSLLQRFEDIDDPYIAERLYAIAFGCTVNEDSPGQVKKLAEYVYKNIFDKEFVYPNILLRTYAKNIIDYALYIGCIDGSRFNIKKITPPYKSKFPRIPSDNEIKKYSKSLKDCHWSQSAILNSMKVEYSRDGQPGGYGDFGRYTFQAYFSVWKELHPMDLKNIAIKRIFDLGYNAEKHGEYDRNCANNVITGTHIGRKERIGKKYQWIAMYELAAQVSDNYMMTTYDEFGDMIRSYCMGSFEPDIRNIDPTVLKFSESTTETVDKPFSYVFKNNSYEEWLSGFEDAPSFEQCTKLHYQGQQYLLLTGEYDWIETKRLGFYSYDLPQKNLWHQIRSYIVKNKHVNSLLQYLKGLDFMSRWMTEAASNSSTYNKEYYWSDAYKFFENPNYYGPEWTSIERNCFDEKFKEKVLIPVKRYLSERKGDLNSLNSEVQSIFWYKPCEEIYKKLNLKYSKGSNSVFIDKSGDLVCFNSSELLGNNVGFYIRQDKLLSFLENNDYSLVWTSLSEKRVIVSSFKNHNLPLKAIHISSVYYINNGNIIKDYEEHFEDRLYN